MTDPFCHKMASCDNSRDMQGSHLLVFVLLLLNQLFKLIFTLNSSFTKPCTCYLPSYSLEYLQVSPIIVLSKACISSSDHGYMEISLNTSSSLQLDIIFPSSVTLSRFKPLCRWSGARGKSKWAKV